MTPAPTSKEIIEGIRSVGNFLMMLDATALACRLRAKVSVSDNSIGVTLDNMKFGKAKYKVAISYSDPDVLWFATRGQIDVEAAGRLGLQVEVGSLVPGRWVWRHCVKLGSQEVDFFSRTAADQRQWLESFLRGCLAKAQSIEVGGRRPNPEQAEGK